MNLAVVDDKYIEFLKSIRSYFKNSNSTIHKARNEIKIINLDAKEFVVKSFKVPNIFNKIVYTLFRDSKAKKSYENSLKIDGFTPKPVGYIEFKKFGFIYDSYFVSEKFDYDFTIREVLKNESFEDRSGVFSAFAQFTLSLHKNFILHLDYSPGNILIKKENSTYIFKIVDINRMEFRELSLSDRLKNFSQLWAKNGDLEIIIKEYARLSVLDEQECVKMALQYSQAHKDRKNAKKRLKGKRVVD